MISFDCIGPCKRQSSLHSVIPFNMKKLQEKRFLPAARNFLGLDRRMRRLRG